MNAIVMALKSVCVIYCFKFLLMTEIPSYDCLRYSDSGSFSQTLMKMAEVALKVPESSYGKPKNLPYSSLRILLIWLSMQ